MHNIDDATLLSYVQFLLKGAYMTKNSIISLVTLTLASTLYGVEPSITQQAELKIQQQSQVSLNKLQESLDNSEVLEGVVIASPSKEKPNYFYHWTRDGGIVMQSLNQIKSSNTFSQNSLFNNFSERLRKYVNAEMIMEKNGYGEPKHLVTGKIFDEPWGRPQNDGTAFRVLNYIRVLEQEANRPDRDQKFESTIKNSIIQNLYYLSEAIHKADVEPWEEVRGFHFFNRLIQAKAFKEAKRYFSQVELGVDARTMLNENITLLFGMLGDHVVTKSDIISASLGVKPFEDKGKVSNLDISTLLAILYTDFPEFEVQKDGTTLKMSFSPDNDQLQNTVYQLVNSFQNIYPINHQGLKGVLIGRYPEDVYDGVGFEGGNPWILSTLALGEYYARLFSHLKAVQKLTVSNLNFEFYKQLLLKSSPAFVLNRGNFNSESDEYKTILQSLRKEAIAQTERVLYHTPTDHNLAEQLNKSSGFSQGARELSWSHVSFLRTHYYLEQTLSQ